MTGRWAVLGTVMVALAACGGGTQSARPLPATRVIEEPSAALDTPVPTETPTGEAARAAEPAPPAAVEEPVAEEPVADEPAPGPAPAPSGGGGLGAPGPSANLPASLTKSDITSAVARVRAEVAACAAQTSAKGTVKVTVRVAGAGTVVSVTVKAAPDPALGECVAAAMQKATFARTQTGGAFSYPFQF